MTSPLRISSRRVLPYGVLLLLLIAVPLFGLNEYYLHVLLSVYFSIVLTASWNFIGGYAGYVNFGLGTYVGLGAYFSALLMIDYGGWSPFLTAWFSGVACALIGLFVGWVTLRLRGDYFAIATLSVYFVAVLLAWILPFFHGGDELTLQIPPYSPYTTKAIFYEIYLGLALLTVGMTLWVDRSRFGYGLAAIRESEDVAEVVGVATTRLKVAAYVLSCFFPGVAGGLLAHYISIVDPKSVFDVTYSLNPILMTVLGGAGTFLGPIIGATLLTLINEALITQILSEAKVIVYGVILIVVVLFLPEGILGLLKKRRRRAALAGPLEKARPAGDA